MRVVTVRNHPCPADSGSSAPQRYDGVAIGSSIGMQVCARRR